MLSELKCLVTIGRMWAENPDCQFSDSVVRMALHTQACCCDPNEFIDYDGATVSYHSLARNELVKKFLDGSGQWLLMLDTDHCFAPDLLSRLLYMARKHECQVLSGLYLRKYFPHDPVANLWYPDQEGFGALTSWDPTVEVMECGPCGGGVLLMHREVLEKVNVASGGGAFSEAPGLSEDYSFFKRCKDLGIKTYLAPNIEAHHLEVGRRSLHAADYLAAQKPC